MGELASLLSEVAEALTAYPDELVIMDGHEPGDRANAPGNAIVVNAREWPSIQEIEQLIANWRALTHLINSAPDSRGAVALVSG